jgi:hypothetical protein
MMFLRWGGCDLGPTTLAAANYEIANAGEQTFNIVAGRVP